MTLNNAEFENVRKDEDVDEPLDGRDSQPSAGSSDAPQTLESEDPLRGVDAVLDENDNDPLQLNLETLQVEPLDEQREIDEVDAEANIGLDEQRSANLPDRREDQDLE